MPRRSATAEGRDELELINYGAGYAWFRAQLDSAIQDADRLDREMARLLERRDHRQPEPRYVLTEAGRRALDEDRRARAMQALFGQPWPSVAQARGVQPTTVAQPAAPNISVLPRP
jgi:hypothetical protein